MKSLKASTTLGRAAGFTFIEVIIVMSLVALIAGVGVAMSYSSLARANVIQERDLLISLLLSGARARALANIDARSHGIHVDNTQHQYTLFEGPSYASIPASHSDPIKFLGVDKTEIRYNGAPTDFDIVFHQRSGNVTAGAGTIELSTNSNVISFNINKYGRIDW